ncbi:unnamed protein product [Camellia sinensis]
MPAVLSLNLFPDFLTKTHLHKTPFPRKILSNFPTTPTRVSISSDSNPPNSRVPITEEFFVKTISGKHNEEPSRILLPEWDFQRAMKFMDDKEAMFWSFPSLKGCVWLVNWMREMEIEKKRRKNCWDSNFKLCLVELKNGERKELKACLVHGFGEALGKGKRKRLAAEQLEPVNGLNKLLKWIEDRGLQRAAVTNAPRPNAELLLSMLGLADFFKIVVLASVCDRVKPFPDAYLKALQILGASPQCSFVFEVRTVSGIKVEVGAGMPVVGLATRNPEKLLADAGAIFVIKDFDDPKLWTALEKLEK